MMMSIIFILLPRAAVSANRINEVLDTKQSIIDGTISASSLPLKGEIEFRNVSFRYPDSSEYVLRDVSFTAHQGETVAFIGSTGSGKSTLINLIPRFYDVTEGEVLVDGVNVKDYKQQVLHNKLGYVPQRAVLFSGSVTSNVTYGDNGKDHPTLKDVKKAVEIAQGQEFVEKMDGQYEAAISQGGTNISGGQKQRIAIARAICRKPEIYIFDDSFSALDYKTDRQLRSVLKKETANTTSLIVAQRIGTIIDADKIIVLDEGKVVGIGTHKELLNTCTVYQEIAHSQLSKEELVS
jgi:ATP-binding cassette subfamily B protein